MGNKSSDRYDNLSEAVAFQIAFEFMIYTYDDVSWYDMFRETCSKCRVYEQYGDFLAPKAHCKKEYAILDTLQYGISENIKNELISNFNITEMDFRPVRNKKGDVVFYQITPQSKLQSIKSVNKIKELKPCGKCGAVQYRMKTHKNKKGGEYYYITKDALEHMHDINVTDEQFEMFLPNVIVSRRVYDYLISKYPRMRFIPLFLKEEK